MKTLIKLDFESLLKEYDDPYDLDCLGRLLEYEEELYCQAEEYMEILVERLEGETESWPQPWYQQINSLSRQIENRDEEPYQTGHFTKAEDALIKKNWKKFIKTYRLPDKPECFARWRNKTKRRSPNAKEEQVRRFVTAFLARGLERNLHQVYEYVKTEFGYPNKGPYSVTEEKIMDIFFHHQPPRAVLSLATILERPRRGIGKKLHISNGDINEVNDRIKWTLPLATKLLKSLMKHSELPLEELKNADINTAVWRKVAEDIGYPYVRVQRFWNNYLHTQLFVKYDVKNYRLRTRILKVLLQSNYEVWTDIRWPEVKKRFTDGFTHMFLNMIMRKFVYRYPGNYRKDPLKKVVTNLLDQILLQSRRIKHRRLKTLTLNKDNQLERVRYEEKLPLN